MEALTLETALNTCSIVKARQIFILAEVRKRLKHILLTSEGFKGKLIVKKKRTKE